MRNKVLSNIYRLTGSIRGFVNADLIGVIISSSRSSVCLGLGSGSFRQAHSNKPPEQKAPSSKVSCS